MLADVARYPRAVRFLKSISKRLGGMLRTGSHPRSCRSGLATVEVALTLPILILISLATIDTCRVIFVRQSAKVAAYECARIAIVPGVTYRDVKLQCNAMMLNRKINDFQLSMSRDPELLIKGELLRVTVAVPADTNSLGISWFYRGRVFEESVAILVEQSSS